MRWQSLMFMLNTIVSYDPLLRRIVPLLADIFVFTYPFYLVYLYLKWYYYRHDRDMKLALYIACVCFVALITNVVIQEFVIKSRPELALQAHGSLLLPHLPTAPFPSDHAAVSRWFFMALRLWSLFLWVQTRSSLLIFFGLSSIVMCLSRIAVWVHWPTDIIAGFCIATFVGMLLIHRPVYAWFDRVIYQHLIRFQHFCFRYLGIDHDKIKT